MRKLNDIVKETTEGFRVPLQVNRTKSSQEPILNQLCNNLTNLVEQFARLRDQNELASTKPRSRNLSQLTPRIKSMSQRRTPPKSSNSKIKVKTNLLKVDSSSSSSESNDVS